MKIGDKVKIRDGSYMLTIYDGKLCHQSYYTDYIGKCQDTFTIIDIGGKYPTPTGHPIGDRGKITNNIIIVNDVNGEAWFCSYINIYKPIKQYTMEQLFKIVGHKFELVLTETLNSK